MTNEELLSKSIDCLRFPLMVGIVLIHSNVSVFFPQENDYPEWCVSLVMLFSDVLPAMCVPLFFFISGYLFFHKTVFCKASYVAKLKSRARSLLLPYLIWNLIGVIGYAAAALALPSLTAGNTQQEQDICWFLESFWAIDRGEGQVAKAPINVPLWFLRDLMVVMVLSPIVYYITRKTRWLMVVSLGICWACGIDSGIPGLNIAAVLFFSAGAYFSIHNVDVIKVARRLKLAPTLFLINAIAITVADDSKYAPLLYCFMIVMGIISAFLIVSKLCEKGQIRANEFLTSGSFFLYAMHGLFISKMASVLMALIAPKTPYLLMFIYLLIPVITIGFCLFCYGLMRRYFPTTTRILTGGR